MSKKTGFLRIAILFLCFLILAALSYLRLFDNYELSTLDLRFSVRPDPPQNKDIVIIEIADDSVEKIGRWPFSRDWHTSLINILSFYGARMIIFDVIFSEPSPADSSLIESTKRAANVYYGFSFDMPEVLEKGPVEAGRFKTPLLEPLGEVAGGSGHINVLPDIDGKTRRIHPFIKYKDTFFRHLGFLVACDYLGENARSVEFVPSREVYLARNNIRIPLDKGSNMLVNFSGGWARSFTHYSYIDIIKSASLEEKREKGAVNLADLKGKVCFVGLTGTGLHDLNPVPLERRYPALGVHVNTFNTIVTNNFLKRAKRSVNLAILLVFSLLVGLVTLKLRSRLALALVSIVLFCFISTAVALFAFFGLWIDLFYPVAALFVIYLALTSYRYLLEIQQRQLIEKELGIARDIQASFLPAESPRIEGVSLAADMNPARQVGGDLYDFVKLDGARLGVMIGDVSGKGMPAALYMARAISEFRLFSKLDSEPQAVITKLNHNLAEKSRTHLFVTMIYLVYDSGTHTLVFANGGHNPPILLKAGEPNAQYLDTKEGMPLGMVEGVFSQERIVLSRGDKIILYTDGVTEAKNASGDEFGTERLEKLILSKSRLDAESLMLEIKNAILGFAKGAPQHDDITIMVLEVKQ